MYQSRYGGAAVGVDVSKYDPYYDMAPPARRKGGVTMAAGLGTAAAGAGLVNASRSMTSARARAQAQSAQAAAREARKKTAEAATRVRRTKDAKASRKATDDYRRALVDSSSKQNYYDARRRMIRQQPMRQARVFTSGVGALAAGAGLLALGAKRRRES